MLDRIAAGEIPAKHHIQLRGSDGALRHEHCLTRAGFDGPFTIAYHLGRPHEQTPRETEHGHPLPNKDPQYGARLSKQHIRSQDLAAHGGPPIDARLPLVFNADLVVSLCTPGQDDPVFYANGERDELLFIHEGGGRVVSPLGELSFVAEDYVFLPRGLPYRLTLTPGLKQRWLSIECSDLHLPRQWRNEVGQLRMDAPYCHRDFQRPRFSGPTDDGVRDLVVKRNGAFHGFSQPHSFLDVVGWDGSVYPWVFPILNFQPRVSSVHLPPTWHGTFACKAGLICSFVPRLVDFHELAIPCPYPHSSHDVDELLFYQRGNFTSRRGVGSGSISFHPAGLPHGPHPGAYEASIGHAKTDELAVMLDVFAPLSPTMHAAALQDPAYMASFL